MINTNKKRLIIVSFLFPISLLYILYLRSQNANSGDLGFKRHFITWTPHAESTVQLSYNSYYLAGNDATRIYLGNILNPLHIITIDPKTSDTSHVNIRTAKPFLFTKIKVSIIPPRFYLTDPVQHSLWSGNINDWIAAKSVFNFAPELTPDECIPLSMRSFIFRAVKNKSFVLGKISAQDSTLISPFFLKAQGDPIFSVDGTMQYDYQTGTFAYVYFYRNQFVYSDSTLKAWNYFSTIDTNQNTMINHAEIKSSSELKMSSPAKMVNRQSYLYENTLFVLSKVRADNDDRDLFISSSAIDIYQLPSGAYKGSIYIPHDDGKALKEFLVTKQHLVARFERSVIFYSFPQKLYR